MEKQYQIDESNKIFDKVSESRKKKSSKIHQKLPSFFFFFTALQYSFLNEKIKCYFPPFFQLWL